MTHTLEFITKGTINTEILKDILRSHGKKEHDTRRITIEHSYTEDYSKSTIQSLPPTSVVPYIQYIQRDPRGMPSYALIACHPSEEAANRYMNDKQYLQQTTGERK